MIIAGNSGFERCAGAGLWIGAAWGGCITIAGMALLASALDSKFGSRP